MTKLPNLAWALLGLCVAGIAAAEQMQPMGAFEAHYSLVPTMFLKPEIAARYGIIRGRDRALLNVSILDADDRPVRAGVSGTVKNLLEQQWSVEFREVIEGPAVYYLAQIQHTDREVLRFAIDIATPDGAAHRLAFHQKMYVEDR